MKAPGPLNGWERDAASPAGASTASTGRQSRTACTGQINGKYHLDTHQADSWGAHSSVWVMRPRNETLLELMLLTNDKLGKELNASRGAAMAMRPRASIVTVPSPEKSQAGGSAISFANSPMHVAVGLITMRERLGAVR
eukprot:6196371-Pleurochrysis_carterae.AAC.1